MASGFRLSNRNLSIGLVAILVGVLSACSGGGGGSSSSGGGGGTTGGTLSTDQSIFQAFELSGGSYQMRFNMPYGGGNLVSGTNYFYYVDSALTHSPIYGAQTETPTVASMVPALAILALPVTRYLVNGAIAVRLLSNARQVTYANNEIQVANYANDGSTVVETVQLSNFTEVALNGNMGDSPQELQSLYPIADWIAANNFSGTASWQSGAAYNKRKNVIQGDTYYANDCANAPPVVATTGSSPVPCATGNLSDIFPITLYAGSGHPYETDFEAEGTYVTIQGLPMWVANQPLPTAQSPTQEYRTYFQLNGNVYMGYLIKNGTAVATVQADGSVVDYSIALNQAAVGSVQPAIIAGATAGSDAGSPVVLSDTTDLFGIGGHAINGALAPADLAQHYNLPPGLDGTAQTVAIVSPPGPGDPSSDLDTYSEAFGLPKCDTANGCFTIDKTLFTSGTITAYWGRTIALETQLVHAIAPGAKIILVEANSSVSTDILAATNLAATLSGVTVVMVGSSFRNLTLSEMQAEDAQLASIQSSRGTVYFAASGDVGAYLEAGTQGGPGYPANSPYVTAVGGTTIDSIAWTSSSSETAWQFSSGGASGYASMPTWQSNLLGSSLVDLNFGMRATPDVAAVADAQRSAVAVYYKQGWIMGGGTSAATSIWAGIGALVGQEAVNKGTTLAALVKGTPGGFNGLLYTAASVAGSSAWFHDIVAGPSNDLSGSPCNDCSALTGYDDVSGLGVPNAASLVPGL